MAINSREKGKRGELELASELKKYGYASRRNAQYCGKAGDADVVGLPKIFCEVKRVQALNIDKAMAKAQDDAKNGDMPVVFHRKNNKPWLVTLGLDDFMKLFKAWDKND